MKIVSTANITLAFAAIEKMLQRAQPMVFDADRLALDLARAVAALIDQHPQHLAATDLLQVTQLAGRDILLRPWQACVGGTGRGQPKHQQEGQQVSQHARACPRSVGGVHVASPLRDK